MHDSERMLQTPGRTNSTGGVLERSRSRSVEPSRSAAFLWLLPLLTLFASLGAHAHEIRPTVIDMSIDAGEVRLVLRANVEALLADISPEHDDTDQSPNAQRYDRLRELAPEALRSRLIKNAGRFVDTMELIDDQGGRVALALSDVTIPPVGDVRLPRDSRITVTGLLRTGVDTVSWQWTASNGPVILRHGSANSPNAYSAYLAPGKQSAAIAVSGEQPTLGAWQNAVNYIQIGFVHIIPRGVDHILFVIGLFLLAPRWRPIVWQVSCFTVAHTFTLALATLGYVSIPAALVEPLIALSIAAIGIENLFVSAVYRWRNLVVFSFGLLHGLGFASVLADVGLHSGHFLGALIAFNIGVEIGQLSVIVLCFVLVGWPLRERHLVPPGW